MFKRVVSHKGFWKSVVVLSFIYGLVIYVIQWGFQGKWSEFFEARPIVLLVFIAVSFLVGFLITYGKFWRKLKEQDYRR